jgi:hypothetical protein
MKLTLCAGYTLVQHSIVFTSFSSFSTERSEHFPHQLSYRVLYEVMNPVWASR